MRAIGSALLVTVACGAVAAVPYFMFRDDFFVPLIGRQNQTHAQTQISYEDQIADLRAQVDRMSRLNQERVEEIKSLLQRQAILENVTSGLAKDLSIQARNVLPTGGAIESTPELSPIETTSAIPAKQAEQAIPSDKKARRAQRKQARVVRKRTQEVPAVAADHSASGPAVQQNY